jgi:hypothetical protein
LPAGEQLVHLISPPDYFESRGTPAEQVPASICGSINMLRNLVVQMTID